MGFFNRPQPEELKTDVNIRQTRDEEDVVENTPENETGKSNKNEFITITWGPGMPIDIIFEEDGYQDALVNSDLKYRETKEEIIRNDLKMLFRRIVLRYQKDMRMINVQINNAEKSLALTAASMMEAQRETYEEHLHEIEEMERRLDENDPKMTTMIESYRRGFFKGIAAQAERFINN